MISIDFFGCRREQIATCSWADACERFPCTGISLPDASALISLGEVLGGTVFANEVVPHSREPFYELGKEMTAVIREAQVEDVLDAGARWAQLPPWSDCETNPMDLAGFLLHLHSLVAGPENVENAIFLWVESGHLPTT